MPGSKAFLLGFNRHTLIEEERDGVRLPQADLCPRFLARHPHRVWAALALNLSPSLFSTPTSPNQLSAQPMKTNLGEEGGWAAYSFPSPAATLGGGVPAATCWPNAV